MKIAKSASRRKWLTRKNLWFKIEIVEIVAVSRKLLDGWSLEYRNDTMLLGPNLGNTVVVRNPL